MPPTVPVLHTDIPGLERFRTGKVRDVYAAADVLVIIATIYVKRVMVDYSAPRES